MRIRTLPRYPFLSILALFVVFPLGCQQQQRAERFEENTLRTEEFEMPPRELPEQAVNTAHGELVRVDPRRAVFVVRTDEGAEMEFTYDESTIVRGAQEGVEGLLAQAGAQVMVEFERGWTSHTATLIEILSRGSDE